MHYVIDSLAILILLYFFFNGWKRGAMVSTLGIVRIIVSLIVAYFVGKYVGTLLADKLYKPRLVTWLATGTFAFGFVAFAFRILIVEIHARNQYREEKEGIKISLFSSIGGGIISLGASALTLVLIYWIIALAIAAFLNTPIPGSADSVAGPIAERTIYEISYRLKASAGNEEQAAATATMLSNPAQGFETSEAILESDSVQGLLNNPEFANDFLSGDPKRLENSPAMQAFFSDEETLNRLRSLGILSKKDTQSGVSEKLAAMGTKLQAKLADEKMQQCLKILKEREILSPDKIPELIRDPYFHLVLDTVLK